MGFNPQIRRALYGTAVYRLLVCMLVIVIGTGSLVVSPDLYLIGGLLSRLWTIFVLVVSGCRPVCVVSINSRG